MQPIADDILKNSGMLLVSLQRFTAAHAPGYQRIVNAVLRVDDEYDAVTHGHRGPEPVPRRKRGHVKHRLLVAWDAALAGSESILQVASRALGRASKLLFRCSDYVGDRRPTCVFECSVCDRRGHETRCFFTGDQVLCYECILGAVERCNAGRSPDEPIFTSQMLMELLTLDTVPYWHRTEEGQWLREERELRAVRRADINAVDEPVRERWSSALRLFACRLAFARESSDERVTASFETILRAET